MERETTVWGQYTRDGDGQRGATASPFYPITGPRAAEQVVDEIAVAIRSGIYRPGDKLPTIQGLAAAMGVSKPTVGEAIRILAREGVVKAYRGASGGTIVASSDIPLTLFQLPGSGQEISLRELLEARHVVEMELALLAGERARDQDLTAMRSTIDELAQAIAAGDWAGALQADHLFHYAMGRAAQSGMLAVVQHQILVRLAELFDGYIEHDMEQMVAIHAETMAAIESHDRERIRRAMQRHLAVLEEHAPNHANVDGRDGRG